MQPPLEQLLASLNPISHLSFDIREISFVIDEQSSLNLQQIFQIKFANETDGN